jgi:hypothetical protein
MDVGARVLIGVDSNILCIFQNEDLAWKIGDLVIRTGEFVTDEEADLIEG